MKNACPYMFQRDDVRSMPSRGMWVPSTSPLSIMMICMFKTLNLDLVLCVSLEWQHCSPHKHNKLTWYT